LPIMCIEFKKYWLIFYINVKNNPEELPQRQIALSLLSVNYMEFNTILFHESFGMRAA
jgi:hypothetical protein